MLRKKRVLALYSLLCERYSADIQLMGGPDRMIQLESRIWIRAGDIKKHFEDIESYRAIRMYQRFNLMGLPYGAWGDNPNKLVELIEMLKPLDQHYHPKII